MDFIWNKSLKKNPSTNLGLKNAQKRVQNELERETMPSTKKCQSALGKCRLALPQC